MITGSHNPANYNGFKMVLRHGAFFGEDIQKLGRMAAEGDWENGAGSVSDEEVMDRYVDRLLAGLRRRAPSGSAGTPATARAGRWSSGWRSACPASIICSTPRWTAASPTTIPIPTVESNLEDLKALVAREGPRFRDRARRRRRPDRRGRRRRPRGLGRPIALDPRRAGAGRPSRRHDHRRRQGEPGLVRPDRRARRQAADVEDRPQPDQVEDEGDRSAARRRDERPHLLRRRLVRLRRRHLCRASG